MSKSAEKIPPSSFLPFGEILSSYCGTWRNLTHRYFMHHWTSLWFLWQKSPPPQDEGKFFDFRSIHFRQFWATLVFVAEKPPPPRMRENFLTSDLSISGNFEQLWFLWQKSPPPPGWGKIFWLQIYPFQAILSNFGFCGRKAPPPPQDEGKFFDFRSIHFRQFWATLVFVAEKSPPRMRENLTSDLSISGNFKQLWFLWQKSPPPPQDEGKFFDFRSIHFRQFRATLVFVAEKPPPPGWGKIFWLQIYPFQAISSNFGFCGRKAPPPRMRENFLTSDLSISGNFEQLWFLWQNFFEAPPPPPPGWGKIFWLQIYPFQAILSNFGFCGRKAPPPPGWGKIFWLQIYPFQAILSNFGFCGRKAPSPRMRENFLTSDLSISGNFEQLWFLWQKSPPTPPGWGKIFWLQIYPFQAILSNFGFCGRKAPPQDEEKFWLQIYPFQAILSNFGFCGRKAPPKDVGKCFDFRSIHFRQFWATLGFVAENRGFFAENCGFHKNRGFWLKTADYG